MALRDRILMPPLKYWQAPALVNRMFSSRTLLMLIQTSRYLLTTIASKSEFGPCRKRREPIISFATLFKGGLDSVGKGQRIQRRPILIDFGLRRWAVLGIATSDHK